MVMRWSVRLWRLLVCTFTAADPRLLLVGGYLSYVLLGMGLLCLPWARASDSGNWVDALFTAMSAVSTTGLVTLSTGADFSSFGQGVILALMQLGGLGYMTIGSMVVMAVAGRLGEWRERVHRLALNLPDDARVQDFLRMVFLYTLVVEGLGAVWLTAEFRASGVENPLWSGIFHSVSAFCTAGFGLYDTSFEAFRDDLGINAAICILSLLGALGFLIVHDLWRSLRIWRAELTFTSRIILISTAVIVVGATVAFNVEEDLVGRVGEPISWMRAFFQVVSASTTVGFNTVPIGELSGASAYLLLLCMLIGASPAGTGGGIKTTTVTACWAIMTSVLRQQECPTFLGRQIPDSRRRLAVATVLLYIMALSLGIYLLAIFDRGDLFNQIFECVSALSTVGLSRGITAGLSDAGKLVVTGLMFIGRVGPLFLATALFRAQPTAGRQAPPEDVII